MARLRDEEQGAVLAMVAISLIVMLGMLVLVFDLGRGVTLKRNMVNAADAGALAAARECGLAHGEASARQAAGELVADNNDAATVTGFQIDPNPAVCSGAGNPDPDGKNTVTVTVNVPQQYFFAQIFGFDSGTVAATATAEWTLELSGPAPLKVEALKVDDCLKGGTGSHCYVGYDNSGQQYGWLNFPEGWPLQGEPNPPTSCPSTGGANDLMNYVGQMGTGGSGFSPTLWNVPVWVCAKDGKNTAPLHAIQTWIDTVGNPPPPEPRPVVSFPVVAPASAPCPAEGCWPRYVNPVASYPVIKFQGFYIENVFETGHDIDKAGHTNDCGFSGKKAPGSAFCIELSVVAADQNPTNGSPTVRLVE
ncbi:MAG: pilus assembly protein TadG-related protein [Actinomycetota bacterium]